MTQLTIVIFFIMRGVLLSFFLENFTLCNISHKYILVYFHHSYTAL